MKGSILNKTIVHFFTNFRNNSIKKNPSNFVNRPKKKTAIRHDKIPSGYGATYIKQKLE